MLTVHAPNRALRRSSKSKLGVTVSFLGRTFTINSDRRDARRTLRGLAAGGFSTSSSAGTSLTVNQLLRQPTTISRDLLNVILQRGGFLADKLLVQGTPDQVAGGAARYQRSGSSYLDGQVEEIGEDADWARSGWTEEMRTAAVKQYGLEVPISALSIRRNQVDQVTRAERRLANSLVKFVDTQAIAMLRTDPDILGGAAADWTNAATDIISDIANAQEAMDVLDEGINGTTLFLPKTMRVNFLKNTALRDALKALNGSEMVRTGQVANFLGLENIYFTNQIPDAEALLIDTGIAGTIADESPDPAEGWQAYQPGPGFRPIYVQVYQEKRPKRTVVAAGRWPAMFLVEPRAVYHFTTTTS